MSRSEHHGAGCYWGVWSGTFQWIETRNICMYVHVQANRHANIPAWHTDFRNNLFTPIPLMVINHAELYLAFSHCDLYIPFATMRTQAPIDIRTLTHLLKLLIHLKYFQNCRITPRETNLLKSGQDLFGILPPSTSASTEGLDRKSVV